MEIEVFGPNSLKEANNVIILLQKYVLCPPFLLYANEESVDRALHKLLSNLEIPIETQDRIRGIIGGIKTLFKQEKPIDFIISGSYSRDTALYPLHDVDLIVVLPEGFRGSRKPHDVLKKVCKLVDGKEFSFNLKDEILKKIVRPRMQTRSIGFDIDEISFDIVPAFKKSDDDGGTYVIPDNNSGTWIETTPKKHKDMLNNLPNATSMKEIIKLIKYWQKEQQYQYEKQNNDLAELYKVPSFRIEVILISCELLQSEGSSHSLSIALELAFYHLWNNISNTPEIFRMTETESINSTTLKNIALDGAHKIIFEANKAQKEGRYRAALLLWESIFKDLF